MIAINGRFLQKRATGVQRYAREIASRIGFAARVIRAGRGTEGMGGHVWEQTTLVARAGDSLLWSPCNTGPLVMRRQVLTVHDTAFFDKPECFSPRFVAWYQWLIPRLARSVRCVITVSEFSKSRLVELCDVPPRRVHVIANGVDGRFVRPAPQAVALVRRCYGLPDDYVLAVGSVEPRKNLEGLLVAWEIVRRRHPNLTLALAGARGISCFRGGPSCESQSVRWLGFVNDIDLPALYGGARAFVFPSFYEGFGLPPLEAMSCGTPVVCSHGTSLPEVVGNAAILVDPLEPESIAQGIERVISDETLRERLRTEGLRQAAKYSWERAARETYAVLQAAATR